MATIERYRMAHRQIAGGQREEFRRMAERVFAPNETTRADSYLLLPHLDEEGMFVKRRVDYEIALAAFLKKEPDVRLLDLGCGAGFWLEKQAARNHRLKVYGISAKDYRRPEDRPLVSFMGKDNIGGDPIFKSQNGYATYVGIELDRTTAIDDGHYFIGDAHETLKTFPTNFFHLIVSYQACRYLFDPLRVLKQIHRTLVPNGYAFLESFTSLVFNQSEDPVSDEKMQKMFRRCGHSITWGEYRPTELHTKSGLAIKKTKTRLILPIKYRQVVNNPIDKTRVVTYYLDP